MEDGGGGGASRTTEPASGTSTGTDVGLDRHLSTVIAYESKNSKHWLAFAAMFGAFAWSEIQRRLEILNHENARLLQQQEKTVSQDTYTANEQQRKEEQVKLDDWRKAVDGDRSRTVTREEFQQTSKTEKHAAASYLGVIVGAVAVTVIVLLALYAAFHGGTPHR